MQHEIEFQLYGAIAATRAVLPAIAVIPVFPTAPAGQISPVYWELHATDRDKAAGGSPSAAQWVEELTGAVRWASPAMPISQVTARHAEVPVFRDPSGRGETFSGGLTPSGRGWHRRSGKSALSRLEGQRWWLRHSR